MARRRRRYKTTHAATRHAFRSDDEMEFDELTRRVKDLDQIEFLQRQTCSRSLIRTMGVDGYIYCIINRPKRSIITVLTEEQAAEQLKADLREIPSFPMNLT